MKFIDGAYRRTNMQKSIVILITSRVWVYRCSGPVSISNSLVSPMRIYARTKRPAMTNTTLFFSRFRSDQTIPYRMIEINSSSPSFRLLAEGLNTYIRATPRENEAFMKHTCVNWAATSFYLKSENFSFSSASVGMRKMLYEISSILVFIVLRQTISYL